MQRKSKFQLGGDYEDDPSFINEDYYKKLGLTNKINN